MFVLFHRFLGRVRLLAGPAIALAVTGCAAQTTPPVLLPPMVDRVNFARGHAHGGPLTRAAFAMDPLLEKILLHAAARSPAMIEQEFLVARADAFRFRGWRQHMPFISGDYRFGMFTLIRGENRGGDTKTSGTYSLNLRYPFYAWGAIAAEKNSAFLREKAAQSGSLVAWRKFVGEVRRDYHRAVVLKGAIAHGERQLAFEKRRQGRSDALLEAGRLSDSDRLAQAVAFRQREHDLDMRRMEIASVLSKLHATTGFDVLALDDIPLSVPCPDVDCAFLERQLDAFRRSGGDDVEEARANRLFRDQLDEEITQAEARMLPNLNLGASIAQSPYQTNTNRFEMQTIAFVGVSGTWNIFDRDIAETAVRSLKAQQRALDAQLHASRLSRLGHLKNQLAGIRLAQDMVALRRRHLETAGRQLDAARREGELGRADALAIEEAEVQVSGIRQAITNDEINIADAYFQFLSGIGQDPAATLYSAPQND
jgi:outer membrane protein TolC